MGTLEVDKSLKAAFKETLEPHGFKKVKGRYPHFVRMATPEIIQVINYRLEQALSPQLEEKRFEVYCAVGSIYRPEINLNRSVYASMDWINTTHLEMYVKAKRNGIPVYENEQPGVDYIIKKGDEASLREQIAFAMTGIEHYVIPAFDKVVDLKTCVDYLELYAFSNLYISRKTECNEDVFILPAKYPNKESYRVKVQSDYQEIKMELKQDILDNKITEEEVEACLSVTKWYPASREYMRGGGYSSQFLTRGEMPVTMCRLNLVKGQGPVLQIAEGWTVNLDKDVFKAINERTDRTWPSTFFAPRLTGKGYFRDVYTVMNNWGANHGAISYGHIGADLITLASMLRIPVCMHNVSEEDIFRPSAWTAFGEDMEGSDYRACKNYGPLYK